MAINISNEIMNTVATEVIAQAIIGLQGAGAGAFDLSTDYHKGDNKLTNSFLELTGLIEDRDPAATGNLTPKAISTGETNVVKNFWSTGAVEINRSDMLRYGHSTDAFSAIVGKQYGAALIAAMLNRGLLAAVAAIQSEASAVHGDGTGALDFDFLNDMNAKFGDASDNLGLVAGTGAEYHKLVGTSIAKDVDRIAGVTIMDGTTGALGRPFLRTDSPSLDLTTGKWALLALVNGAITLRESEQREVLLEKFGGKENIRFRFQAEGAFDVGVLGYTFDKTKAGTKANIGTTANWGKVATDIKSTAGVLGNLLRG